MKSCLRDRPLEIVKNLDELNEIWARLDTRYGIPSKIVDVIINELKCIRPVKDDYDQALIQLVDTVETAHRDLSIVGVESELSNSSLVSLIEEKLPKHIRREWSKVINERDDLLMNKNKFPGLLKFLIYQRRIIEYETSHLRSKTECKSGHSYYVSEGHSPVNAVYCWIHRTDGHNILECREYLESTPEDRVRVIRDNRVCWSCIGLGHRSIQCRRRKQCPEMDCGKYHHESLHETQYHISCKRDWRSRK